MHNVNRQTLKPIIFLISCAVLALVAQAEPLKVYMIGNSLTDEVKYDDWIKLCAAGGEEALYARKMIPGSPLSWHQEHPTDGFKTNPYGYPDTAFKEYTWDVLTLQPFNSVDREILAARHYANLMWENSPHCKVFVYAQWPNRNSDDWIAAWMDKAADYTAIYKALRAQPAHGDQVFMIPTGWALYRLEKKMQLGLVPGYTSIWQIYSDGVHVSNVGSYVVGLSYYATIFGKSPVGLPVGGYQAKPGSAADYFEISPELARILQDTVWEAVTAHLNNGVKTDLPITITLPGLIPAVEKEPYRWEIDAAFGTPPYSWNVVKGRLPNGVELTPAGWMDGTPLSQGSYLFTAQVTDAAGKTAARDFTLTVGEDSAPKIVTKKLPDLTQGAFIQTQLEAAGGNGAPNWSVTQGQLPPGLVLMKNGLLSGSPAVQGSFEVTLQVQDSDGANPETDTISFSGTIAPADPSGVLFVRKSAGKINVDGTLDPSEGWDLVHELKKPLVGKPNNIVRFDAQYNKGYGGFLYVAVEVEDDAVLKTGSAYNSDCVVFYLDGKNNREGTYNMDDQRIVIGLDGRVDRSNTIGPDTAIRSAVKKTDKGYIIEARFTLNAMGVPDQIEGGDYNAAGAVIGFDLVNRDLDTAAGGQTRLGWQGTANNPDDPSQFGTIILTP